MAKFNILFVEFSHFFFLGVFESAHGFLLDQMRIVKLQFQQTVLSFE